MDTSDNRNNRYEKDEYEEPADSRQTSGRVTKDLADRAGAAKAANDNERDRQEKNKDTKKEVLSYVKLIAIVLVVMFLLQRFIIVNARIPSASMEPTIMTGDQIFGNRLAYKVGDPQRYDIIIFRYPDDESRLFIKRIIGLPGDTVDIHDGNVYINGESVPLDDSYCALPDSTSTGNLLFPITVPEDCYFVLGDNRENSSDARYWMNTFVRRDKILGKAFFRYWPLNKMSVIHGALDSYYEPDESQNPYLNGEDDSSSQVTDKATSVAAG